MRLSGEWHRSGATQKLMALLGEQTLFVGGCVRDDLLGRPVADIDIATPILPETVIATANAANFQVIPTGLKHGTVSVLVEGVAHEVTTFRRDVDTDGRHAEVAFTDQLQLDAARRDFTVNALYARADGTVIDPLAGIPDLMRRYVRFIGDPHARIREDFLRILRFFRFSAQIGDPSHGLDADGLAACHAGIPGLAQLSCERITQEMFKLAQTRDPAQSIAAMRMSGVLSTLWPGANDASLAPLIHVENKVQSQPRALRRLAILGMPDMFRLSKAQMRDIATMRTHMVSDWTLGHVAYRFGANLAWDVALLRAAIGDHQVAPNSKEQIDRGARATFPVAARDLSPPLHGPALGQALKQLETTWITSDFSAQKKDLLARFTGR